MASSSSTLPIIKYNVFLSFRGEDTRDNFTSHLYSALFQKQIQTFIDNQLIRGHEISQSLLDAIEASQISLVIFSETYADSRWCLEELVKILECKNKHGQIVIPVFYHVDPSDVRNQTGTFRSAFLKLEERFQGRIDKVREWRIALRAAANLSGFDSRVFRSESELIEGIAEDILRRLNDMFTSDDNDLVGVGSRIKRIESLLSIGSTDVISLGIWGIGGIGKTTIAQAIFNKISNHFESSYFVENVREAEKNGGLQHLQRELFSTLLADGNVKIGIANLNFQIKRLNCKKVLIVFDDVTRLRQIESLIGRFGRLAPGSRIIITSRDKQVLQNCKVDEIYEMEELIYSDALELFNRHAFRQNLPDESYVELSKKAIEHTHGVPLALKVLGCFLFERSKEVWESTMSKLKKVPNVEIQDVLKISYDDLDDNEKDIFLDIACFFVGKEIDHTTSFLDACGFFARVGISVLHDKSLITIRCTRILMHDLLRKMGKEIVRQESVHNPGKRSRLWHHEDVYQVLTKNMGTDAITGIVLNMFKVKEISLSPCTFTKMPKLRFLKFYGVNKCKVSCFEGPTFTELRYFRWDGYPLQSLPSSMNPENLVSLIMPDSNVEQFWDGVQNLSKLKEVELVGSKQLRKLPDLSLATNLETLELRNCTSLTGFPEISSCNILKLDLENCGKLESLPSSLCKLKSLQYLDLSGCSNLKTLPDVLGNLESLVKLSANKTAITKLPSSIGCLSTLQTLQLCNCKMLESLPSSLCELKSLHYLDLSGCLNLKTLPDVLGNLASLVKLLANKTAIAELPSSIGCLLRLRTLQLCNCKILQSLPSSLCELTSLESLTLNGCVNIQSLPDELGNLKSLKELLADETAITELPSSIGCLSKLHTFLLRDCKKLESLPSSLCMLISLRILNLDGCSNLQSLPDEFGDLKSLKGLYASETAIREVPSSIVYLNNLEELSLKSCRGDEQRGFLSRIISFPLDSLCSLKHLILSDYSITELPESLGQVSSLEELYLDKNNFGRIPSSIIHLSKLRTLSISCCKRLRCVPELPCNVKYVNASCCASLEALSGLSVPFERLWLHGKIDLINCLKLEPAVLSKIIKDAFQKIQNLCWKEQDQLQIEYQLLQGEICYPGSEIPEWFIFQNTGSSVNPKLPPGSMNDKSVGYAFCAIVSFQDHHDNDGLFHVRCVLKYNQDPCDFYDVGSISKVESDHVVLGYGFRKYCGSGFYHNNFVSFNFYIEEGNGKRVECCQVKKCGIHSFFAKEYCRRSSSFDEEEEPSPKRFKSWYC